MTNQEINFAAIYIANIAKEENAVEKVNIAIQSLLSSYDMESKVSTAMVAQDNPKVNAKKFLPFYQLLLYPSNNFFVSR